MEQSVASWKEQRQKSKSFLFAGKLFFDICIIHAENIYGGSPMAFDGITTAAVVYELNKTLTGGGISRIVQSEKDDFFCQPAIRRFTASL